MPERLLPPEKLAAGQRPPVFLTGNYLHVVNDGAVALAAGAGADAELTGGREAES